MNIAILGPSTMIHVRRMVRALSERGHRVHVVSMKSEPIPGATFERFAVPRPSLRYPCRWRRRWERYMCDLFRRFDVVTVHFLSDWGITAEAARAGRLVARVYGSDIDPPPGAPAPEAALIRARRELLRVADRVVVPSGFTARQVREFADVDASRITTILGGADPDVFVPDGDRAGRGSRVVGYFKGFEPVYGPMTLVEAIPRVLERCPAARFELVGVGGLRDVCRRRADILKVGHAIRWLEPVSHEALPRLMCGWDVVAIASLKESYCVAAVEASAMSLPVVATNVGGLPEAVEDGVTALLVEPDNAASLAAGLVAVLEDPARGRLMGLAGRRRVVARLNWRHEVDAWETLYESLCGDGVPRAPRADPGPERICTDRFPRPITGGRTLAE